MLTKPGGIAVETATEDAYFLRLHRRLPRRRIPQAAAGDRKSVGAYRSYSLGGWYNGLEDPSSVRAEVIMAMQHNATFHFVGIPRLIFLTAAGVPAFHAYIIYAPALMITIRAAA